MSQRVKRPNRSDDGSVPAKRRKRPATAQEEEEATSLASWRPMNDLKIYNRTTTEAPAELFRKDLISAMKLPDSEPLALDEYWVIVDQWKQEWERGVQVPVNPDSLPEPSVTVTHCATLHIKPLQDFKLPKSRYIRITKDDSFNPEEHILSSAPAQAEAACSYDLDESDVAWLRIMNSERLAVGLSPLSEDQLERVIERLELRCWDKIQAILRNEEGLGIEYDENVICDVCRSPDSEEGNEMVFCDSCNICVHQACYGITRIPEGQWLCCTCVISQRPECVLCPNKGGAMKCTRSGQKWAHVSCALWIPEVSIGCVEKMEPITKISSIPQSRWALICVLCRERVGACIQCSVKTCKTAYHVTCAFKHGLEMRAIIEDENADDGVKLRSYCEKHSKSSKKEKSTCSGSEDDDCKRKKRKDMTSEEKNQARAARSQEIEAEFYKHVCPKDIAVHIEVDSDALQCIYNYWKLKRKAGHNKPLLPPKSEDIDLLSHKQEQADLEKMKMFVQLRQDLERVRNLCYMVSRREKLSRTFFRMREQTFHKQVAVIQENLAPSVVQAVIEANHGPSIYDKLYSHNNIDENAINFDTMLARIAGLKSPLHESGDEKKPEMNGLFKDVKNNPYKKLYFNGSSKSRNTSLYGSSLSSASSGEEKPKYNKENRLHSTSEEDKPVAKKKSTPNKSKLNEIRKKKQISRSKLDSSSEEDVKPQKRSWKMSKSRLKQMESELGVSASDSDELMPIKTNALPVKKTISSIYSDSDSSDTSMKNDDKSSNAASDTQSQSRIRTKASVKEFSNKPSTSKSPNKTTPEAKKKSKEETTKRDSKKKDYVPSDLIVPQRQAAKKATENIKSNTGIRTNKEQSGTLNTAVLSESEVKISSEKEDKEKITKPKGKIGRPPKENKEPREEIKSKDRDDKSLSKKETKKEDIFDIDKEMEKVDQDIIAYVPQRQAAKKAAEHIKSGLGKPGATLEQPGNDEKSKPIEEIKSKKEQPPKKEPEMKTKEKEVEVKAKEPLKVPDSKRKSTSSSASSSSSSSSDSTCTSSSDSEDERPTKQPQSESLSSAKEQTKRIGAKDWPFLDKAAKSAASSSSSDSSDSSRPSSPQRSKEIPTTKESPRTTKQPARQTPNKSGRKSTDKKSTPPEREEQIRPRGKGKSPRGRPRTTTTSDRFRDANVRTRDIPDHNERERENSIARRSEQEEVEIKEKENSKAVDKVFSPVRETDKKIIKQNVEPELGNLEKEILERKAASNKPTNKSKFDALFGSFDNKESKPAKLFDKCKKSPQKENKDVKPKQSPLKKSPIKSKCIDDIFANKKFSNNSINKTVEVETIISKKSNFNTQESKEKLDKLNSLEVERKTEVETKVTNKQQSIFFDSNNTLKKSTTQNQSIFSPNPHNKDADILADINNMLDDGFGISKEEISKGPLSFSLGNSMLFKEDSKEDSARETLNLVEKLRMGLSKKSSVYDMDDAVSVTSSTKNDSDRLDFSEQIVPNNVIEPTIKEDSNKEPLTGPQINLEMRVEVMNAKYEEPNLYEKYVNCQNTSVEKNVPEVQQQHLDVTAPSDERWVPPSESYPNLRGVDSKIFNEHVPESVPSFVQQYEGQFEKKLSEDLLKNDSPSMHDRRITQTPYLDPASMDCMPSPSPYNDIHPQAKWAEHQVMPTRRSSSSSAISTTSNSSKRNDIDEDLKRQEILMMNHPNHSINDGMSFGGIPQNLPFPPPSLESYPQFSETSQFVSTPVSLFPPTNINTQIPFPSPGAAMFPPPFSTSFSTAHSVIPPLPKPMEEAIHFPASACTAAFTSSQHNMALTAAMVNLQPVSTTPKSETMEDKISEQPAPIPEVTPTSVEEITSSPALSNSTPNHVEPSPNPSLKSNTSSAGKKSPSKPTRTSARFINQQQSKSPSKSPGKSPRQDISKTPASRNRDSKKGTGKASTGRGTQSQSRGRGRGRGRGRTSYMQHDYDMNTIHNKLVGTVYDLDFDDDISNEVGDLRAMRERRKSVDVHERKTELVHVSRDSSESPKFTSPQHKGRAFNADLRELRPPTPINEEASKSASPEPNADESKTFPSIVTPVLPGPVDMRTYNSSFDPQHFNDENLLGAFGTGATEQPVHEELDELLEKELRSAISGSGNTKKPVEPQVPEVSNIKVSLSDSRNQLKVKIKGPISNYTSTVAPLPPASETTVSNLPINSVVNNTISNSGVGINSGTSTNLRRMRKKELLRQYWTQDMNMDDPTPAPGYMSTPVAPSINRTIITIPKAVASMTSIPTKEDYRDYRTGADDIFETKLRKEKPTRPGLSRELRQLDITMDDGDNLIERRRSIGSNNSNSNLGFESNNKRRGRPPRHSQYPNQTQEGTPKLKIKISGNSIVGGGKIDDKKDRIRPPKKRLSAAVIKPTVEDLKRESMKFRKQVMADFGEEKKEKKKKDKSNKKSKKKKKQEVQIIANDSSSATPKLIIRFGKKTDTERTTKPEIVIDKCQDIKSIENISNKDSERTEEVNVVPDASEVKSDEKRTNKVIPIKLKLSRCQEGSGYVMKKPPEEENKPPDLKQQIAPATTNPSTSTPTLNLSEPPPLPVHAATPLPLNKDCEVR